MNIYLDYLIKNFGGAHLKGAIYASELIEKYDIRDLAKSYHDYAEDNNINWTIIERNIRYYIGNIATTKDIENILKCKCFNGRNFTNQEFLTMIKLRAEESAKC